MGDYEKLGKDGKSRYFLGSREVSEEEYRQWYPKLSGTGFPVLAGWKKPMAMDSLAVHPDDVPEQMEKDRRRGLVIEYTEDGRPLIHSERQKREYMKAQNEKLHDRNSYV